MHPTLPCIDEQNPLYCPLVSAAAFLRSVRRKSKIRPQRRKNEYRVQSFARILERSIALDSSNSSGDDSDSDRRLAPLTCLPSKFDDKNDARSFRIIPGCSDDDALGFSYPIPSWEHEEEEDYDSPLPNGTPWIRSMRDQVLGVRSRVRPSEGVKRKRKRTSFSDILGPPRYARSIQSVHESSFDITLKPEKLSFAGASGSSDKVNLALKTDHVGWEEERPSVLEIRIKELEEQLYGPSIGTESTNSILVFIDLLDVFLPGARLKERLKQLTARNPSHQIIADFLAKHGYLNKNVLNLLRSSKIQRIALSESLSDANGLNLSAMDILSVFSKPNSFPFLSELSFSGTRISDFDITHIQHLPKLSTLLLNNTGISNEAVFLLISLKHSLIQLSIATNPAINDDVAPALLLLSKLSFLSILDTGIGMPGIRRLARTIYDEDRIIDIEIPTVCEEYVNSMHRKYALDPRPPLITNPKVCAQLSIAALQRNLAAHSIKNPDISVVGSKNEMKERLTALLETRKMDMLVRDMILGNDRDAYEEEE